MLGSPLLRKSNKETEAQAAADSAAANSAAPGSLPKTIKTEQLGADRLVASGGAAASKPAQPAKAARLLGRVEQLYRTIKAE